MDSTVGAADGDAHLRQPREGASSTDCFLGIDLGGTKLRLLLADRSGNELSRCSERLNDRSSPVEVVEVIDRSLTLLLRQANRDSRCLRSVGAGVPGVTNVHTGLVKLAPFLSGWKGVPFGKLLQDKLHVPAYVDNDVNLAALGEAKAGVARGESDFVFLALGTGLGAGIFLRGELYRGAEWSSGELGYLRLCECCDSPVDANLPGPLESVIGGPAIERAWQREAAASELPLELSATAIFELASSGVPLARMLLDKSAALLSETIVSVSLVLNCPLFVLGGGVGASPQLFSAVEKKLSPHPVVHPKIEISELGQDAQLVGAVQFAVSQHERQPHIPVAF